MISQTQIDFLCACLIKIELLYRDRNLCNLLCEEVTDMIRLALVEDDTLYRSQLRGVLINTVPPRVKSSP